MKRSRRWLMIGAASLLAAFAFFLQRRGPTRRTLPPRCPAPLTRLELKSPDGVITLEKVKNRWVLRSPGAAPASGEAVSRLEEALQGFTLLDLMTERTHTYPIYMIDDAQAATVKAWGPDGGKPSVWIFGKGAADPRNIFFRFPDRPAVFLGRGVRRDDCTALPRKWRERKLFSPGEGEALNQLRVEFPGASYALFRSPLGWSLLEGAGPPDPPAAGKYLESLEAVEVEDGAPAAGDEGGLQAARSAGRIGGVFSSGRRVEFRVGLPHAHEDVKLTPFVQKEETAVYWLRGDPQGILSPWVKK